MSQPIKIAVIGMSGQGKSTFLNAFADNGDGKEYFATAAGGDSCTREVVRRSFQMKGTDGHELNMELVDTMGFPDPDPKLAPTFYDEVVDACRQPLNAIVWVHMASRDDFRTIERLQSLMQEFNGASPPIYLVLNGNKNYGRKNGVAKEEAKRKDLAAHEEIAEALLKTSGVRVQDKMVCAELDDLYIDVKIKLAYLLKGTVPKSSNIKTYAELKSEFEGCKNRDDEVALQLKKTKMAKDKEESNVRDLAQKKRILMATSVATTAGLFFVPLAGPALCVAAAASSTAMEAAALAMSASIDAAMAKSRKALEALKDIEVDKDAASNACKRARELFDKVDATFQAAKRFKSSCST